jgi:excisionase family DNA binding protein
MTSGKDTPGALAGRYLTVEQVAELMHVQRETVRRWLRRGLLPNARKTPSGHDWRIPTADLDGMEASAGERSEEVSA